jgi:hypothetical protein
MRLITIGVMWKNPPNKEYTGHVVMGSFDSTDQNGTPCRWVYRAFWGLPSFLRSDETDNTVYGHVIFLYPRTTGLQRVDDEEKVTKILEYYIDRPGWEISPDGRSAETNTTMGDLDPFYQSNRHLAR